MPSSYQRKLAPCFKEALTRLKAGNEAERQRYVNALSAMNKVMANPLHRDFSKALPESYKAVDVLQQYRLFFKIIPTTGEGDSGVVYFAWMNDEESLHRSGESDDCYEIFRGMIERGDIDPYAPEPRSEESFKRHDRWGAEHVYVSYSRRVGEAEWVADGNLTLNRISAQSYLLQYVSVSEENQGLAQGLLRGLCEDADRNGIELSYELWTRDSHYGKIRHIIEKFGFKLDEVVEEIEPWSRSRQR